MYRVIKTFVDLQDNEHRYIAGARYPREGGIQPSTARVAELSGPHNLQGVPLIEKVAEPESEKPRRKGRKIEED